MRAVGREQPVPLYSHGAARESAVDGRRTPGLSRASAWDPPGKRMMSGSSATRFVGCLRICFPPAAHQLVALRAEVETEIRVLIAGDHPIFRNGLRQIIEAAPGLKVVAEAEDGERALELIRTSQPHVAVLDVDMPRKDRLTVAREVRALRLEPALIFLTMHKNERFFNAALDCGVTGYVLKDCASAEIVEGIRAVAAGRSYVTPLLTGYLLNRRGG